MTCNRSTADLPVQTGAVPCRIAPGNRVEVLLVTTRRSHRWTIPKGWPMAGKSLAEAAAQEAFEEAGVRGTVDPEPLGSFRHVKRRLVLRALEVSVTVHLLRVARELTRWPEVNQRKRQWFSPKDAARRVESRELKDLILRSARLARRP